MSIQRSITILATGAIIVFSALVAASSAYGQAPTYKQFRLGMSYHELRDSLRVHLEPMNPRIGYYLFINNLGADVIESRGLEKIDLIDTTTVNVQVLYDVGVPRFGCVTVEGEDENCFDLQWINLELQEGLVSSISVNTQKMFISYVEPFAKVAYAGVSARLGKGKPERPALAKYDADYTRIMEESKQVTLHEFSLKGKPHYRGTVSFWKLGYQDDYVYSGGEREPMFRGSMRMYIDDPARKKRHEARVAKATDDRAREEQRKKDNPKVKTDF